MESGESFSDVEAIGLFGSVARGEFSPRSDIDIFIVIPDGILERESWLKWNRKMREILKTLHRDITVLIYSRKSLKEISSWYVLRLASEGQLVYDRNGEIKKIFEKMIQRAKDSGLVEEEIHGHKYWIKRDLRIGQTFEMKMSDEQ